MVNRAAAVGIVLVAIIIVIIVAIAAMQVGGQSSVTPLWSYTTNNGVESVDVSSDDNYIAAGGNDRSIYLFSKSGGGMPLWSYLTRDLVTSVFISSDGSYIAAGSFNQNVYLLLS